MVLKSLIEVTYTSHWTLHKTSVIYFSVNLIISRTLLILHKDHT